MKTRFQGVENRGSMARKTAGNGFHGLEVFPEVPSMAWKKGETGFQGVEVPKWKR